MRSSFEFNYVGKTTILEKMGLGDIVTTIPVVGVSTKTIDRKDITINAWDLGVNNEKFRPLWKHYYPETQGKAF